MEIPRAVLIACLFSDNVSECGVFRGIDGVSAAVVSVNTGTVNYDLMAIASSEQNSRSTGNDAWQAFMAARTTFIDYGN